MLALEFEIFRAVGVHYAGRLEVIAADPIDGIAQLLVEWSSGGWSVAFDYGFQLGCGFEWRHPHVR